MRAEEWHSVPQQLTARVVWQHLWILCDRSKSTNKLQLSSSAGIYPAVMARVVFTTDQRMHNQCRPFSIGTCVLLVVTAVVIMCIGKGVNAGVLSYSPQDVPGPPNKVFLSVASDSALRVQVLPPARTMAEGSNGAPVIGYRVEVAKRVNHVQTFSLASNGPVYLGNYKVTFTNAFGTDVTDCLAWNATAAEFETALEELTNIDDVDVARSIYGAAPNGYVYTITFVGRYLVNGAQPNVLVGDQVGCLSTYPTNRVLTFSGAHVVTGAQGYIPEVWEVITKDIAGTNIIGGSIDLSVGFEGEWSALAITATISAGSKTAFTSAPMVGVVSRGDKIRISGETFLVHSSAPFTDTMLPLDSYHIRGSINAPIYVQDTAIGDVSVTQGSQVVTTATDFSPFVAVGESIKIGNWEFLVTAVSPTSISIAKLASAGNDNWPTPSVLHITAYKRKKVTISVNAEAAEIIRALDGLPGFGSVDASRVGPTANNGYSWYITFLSLGTKMKCPESPCLYADKVTGSNTRLTNVYGSACASCIVTASLVYDATNTYALNGVSGAFGSSSIASTRQISGAVDEVQSIWTQATANNIDGTFAVNFRNSFAQSAGAIINFDDTAADVQTKLQNLPTLGRLNVTRQPNSVYGMTWMITFLSNIGDLPLLIVDDTLLTGSGANVVVEEVVKGIDVPFETIIDGFTPYQDYYVRAFAQNLDDYGMGTDTIQIFGKGALPLSAHVGTAPSSINIVSVYPISGSQMELRFSAPNDHGDSVQNYLFEYAVSDSFGVPSIKIIDVNSGVENDIAGTFQLKYGDQVTPMLSIDVSATTLQTVINALTSLRPVSVTRNMYVLTGDVSSCVTQFVASQNAFTTTALTATQCRLLVSGASIISNGFTFVVSSQPQVGSTAIKVQPGHGATDFTQNVPLIKIDPSGSEQGASGYQWKITFRNEIDQIMHQMYPSFQMLSSLLSVETGRSITSFSITDMQTAVAPTYYGSFEISNDEKVCDTYVIGAPSQVQIIQLFASTTITQGAFQLKLGQEVTSCISIGTSSAASNMKSALEALAFVSKVTIEEQRLFKVSLLSGSSVSCVSAYSSGTSSITVVSSGTNNGLSSLQAAALPVGAIIQVSRNPNDFTRHSCEFVVSTTAPTAGATTITVSPVGICSAFTGETRSLKILDFHDYKIRFWGRYPTGQWPTLRIVSSAFGDGTTCTAWSPAVSVYSTIHTVKYEGVCAQERHGTQTILADADSSIGGTFSLSYQGNETNALSFQSTTASLMRDAIESITEPGTVNVSVSQYGSNGKAWHITFAQADEDEDTIFIKHSYLSGENVYISVYPSVEIVLWAKKNDIQGSFRLLFGGQTTERIGYAATHAKVVQELQKLSLIDSVVALGDTNAGDVGVYALALTVTTTSGSPILTNFVLDGDLIDPTLFLAIREKLSIAGSNYYIQALSSSCATLTANFVGATTAAMPITAGLITKQTRTLPGYVSISKLMPVITATTNTKIFELPSSHGYVVNSVFYINGNTFTVAAVTGAVVTTQETYTGDNVISGIPNIFIYDNKLRTTEDLRQLVATGNELWIQSSATTNMMKFTVVQVTSRYMLVNGAFDDGFLKKQVVHVTYGYKWSLVFRSFLGDLNTINAIPGNNLRGSEVRLATRRPRTKASQAVYVGNPVVKQTVILNAVNAADIGAGASYQFTYGGVSTGNILWTAQGTAIKQALEQLDEIDGVTVTSVVYGNGFVHTITFWGMYSTPTLPLLGFKVINAVTPANLIFLVRGNNAVAQSKDTNLILPSQQNHVFRIYASNAKGFSDVSQPFQTQTSMTSIVPTPPTSVVLGEYYDATLLSVHYRPPLYTGGAEITMYRLEWDSSTSFDSTSSDYGVVNIKKTPEVQQVTTIFRSGTGLGGVFTLSWGGRTTTSLAVDCTAAQMSAALAVITDTTNFAVDPVRVSRIRASWGYTWKVTFLHNPGNLALLIADGSLITGDFPRIVVSEVTSGFADFAIGDFTHEVQDIVTDSQSVLSGTFKINFDGEITSSIAVDATALDMQDALQAVTSLYSIKVTKQWKNQALNTAIWSVTFAYLKGEEMVGAGNIFVMTLDSTAVFGTNAAVRVAEKIVGSDPFMFNITNLRPGVRYYMHAMAYNAEGFGSATSPLSSAVTCGEPLAPSSVSASVVDGTSLAVTWSSSNVNSRCPVDRYQVEWYRSEGVHEEQTITTSVGKGLSEVQRLVTFADTQSISGYFRLSFKGELTQNVLWNAPAVGSKSVKEYLERLSTIGTVDVARQPSTRVIGGLLVVASSHTLTIDASSTATIATSGVSVNDVIWVLGQMFTVTGLDGVLQTITIDGTLATSVPVPVFKGAFGYQWLITFLSGHVGPQELIEAFPSDSWTGNNPGIYVSSVQKGVQPISGTFKLAFASGGLSETTPPLNHDISASDLEHALENLVTLSQVNVTRSGNGYGYNWIVTFVTDLKNDISLLGVDGTLLHGPSVRIMVSRTKVGTQPTFYCEKNGTAGSAAIVQSLTYLISGLQTGQPYAIRVRAHSNEGYGPATYILPSYQTPRTVPTMPLNVQLVVLSASFIKVLWNSPQSNGGALITSYKIEWDTNQAFSNVGSPGFDSEGFLPVKATDSSPFYFNVAVGAAASYYVRVLAINDQGKSPAGFPTPISVIPGDRTPGSPENVQATVLSSYAVYVNWDASSMDKPYYGGNGGLPITQYMIEWDTSSNFDSPASFGLVSGSSVSYIIGGDDPVTGVRSDVLSSGSTYYIRVSAFNAKGAGKPSFTIPPSILAVNQVPSAPRNLTLSVIPSTSIKARWLNPLYDGGSSLKTYQVEWDEQNDFSSGQSSDATIPIVREVQSLVLSSNVVNEEQYVDATVEVVNEVQVVRTTFTGADEIQVIETKNNVVVEEVQTVTTFATDRDEVQEFRLDANDVNEIQAIRTTVGETFETQRITVGAARVSEVQTISLTLYGAAGNLNLIGGTLSFSFDNSLCTHCTMTVKYARTTDLTSTLKESTDSIAAASVKAALIALGNIDTVDVSRSTAVAINGADLTYVYTITFSGNGVAGNVPLVGIQSAITVNSVANSGIPTLATEVTTGNEVTFDPASVFGVVYTCESYSDPYSIQGYSTACTPPVGNLKCASCITAFDGTTFTSSSDLTASIAQYDQLLAGPCAFQADVITATTVTVVSGDVGKLCGMFSGQTLALYKNVQYSVNVPLKTAATIISDGSVVANLLNTVIDSVTVVRTQSITSTFVGSYYDVTFRKRSGIIPLLKCISTSIRVSNLASNGVCTAVTRQTIGSMIAGTFLIGLTTEADATVEVKTMAIPWDASEALMKSTLEEVTSSSNEQVFGTVKVKRSVFSPTGNKWSGGFTWQIEFTSRMGDIPIMKSYPSLTNSDSGQTAPTIAVEDEAHPFSVSFAGSRQGNQILGSITFSFNGQTSPVPCVIGTNTILTRLHQVVEDTLLEAFIVANLAPAIPSIQIMRSAATQARGFTWTITFSDQANGGDVPMLGILPTSLSTTSTNDNSVSAGVYETIKGNQLGGTFQLKFNGETTGPILFSADKSAVQAQLNSLSTIKPSSVLVDRTGPAISATNQVLSYTWLITFRSSVWADPTSDHSSGITGNWKGARAKWDDIWTETGYSKAWGRQVGPMWSIGFKITCIKDGLTTTASDNSQDCTSSVSVRGVGPIKGTFTITLDSTNAAFMSKKTIATSAPIAHNAWATAVQSGATGTSVEEILESMLNVGDVAVSRSPVDVTTGGYVWTVTFLRDAEPCEQEEVSTDGTALCNSPGDVPAMVADATGLSGSSPTATVCEKTNSAICYVGTVRNGLILRGDFTAFNVLNDPGFGSRYYLTIACTIGSPPCDPIANFAVAPGSGMLQTQLVAGDRFTVGTYSACIYTVVSVTATNVQVTPQTCAAMVAGMNNNPRSVNILLPWNAKEDLVERVLEASSDTAKEYGIWQNGRKVSVQRTIHGKYGEVSWQVQFISNPGFTPPGSGNIADITTTFVPNPISGFGITVTQTTPGSDGLSGSFLIDFHSTMGPRQVSFDESEDQLQRKLNELNTIGRVIVKRLEYPSTATGCLDSTCSAGWDNQPVDNPGTRGGYRWRIRFMKVTGEYGGVTFPSGSGNVGSLSVSASSLAGNENSVDVSTNVAGSDPITGSFALNTSTHATPLLPYSSSADSVKQGIESMDLFGEVDVVQNYLVNQLIPNAVATVSKDGLTASITGIDDIRQFIAPGNIIRFGTQSVNNLGGTNGDNPLTSVLSTSTVQVAALSPVVIANPATTKLLFPGMQLRIDGLVYDVQRSGQEVQTVTVTRPTASWATTVIPNYFSLQVTRGGATAATLCLAFNQDYATVETNLITALQSLGYTTQTNDIQVTRSGPVTVTSVANGQQTGYVYSIYFQGDDVAGDVSQLRVGFSGCTATITGAQVVIDTVKHGGDIGHQLLLLATDSGQVVDTTGYFTLTLNGHTTGCLTWGISETDLETQLEMILNAGDVLVARRGSGQSITEVQRLRMTSNSEVTSGNTGLFQLMFTIGGNTAVTGCLAYGISADDLQTAINQMSNLVSVVNHVNVTRDGDGTSAWGYGYEYLINFEGPASGGYSIVLGNVNQMKIINIGTGACAAVASGNPALIIETLREGEAGFTYDIYFLDYVTAYTPLLALQDERTATCTTGWVQNGGSSRKASVESISLGGSSEIQTLVVKDTGPPSVLGSYKLTFAGVTTGCIPFASTASQLQTTLTGLSTIGSNGVLVSRDIDPLTAPNGFVYQITFVGELVTGNVPLLVIDATSCQATAVTSSVSILYQSNGGQSPGKFALTSSYEGEHPGSHVAYSVSQLFTVMDEQFEIQQVIVSNPNNDITVATGAYTLVVLGVTTISIPWNADENTMQTALTVTGVTSGDIIVTRRTDSAAAPNGYVYLIYFSGSSVTGNIALITLGTKTNFGSGTVVPSLVRNGVNGISMLTKDTIPLASSTSTLISSQYLASDSTLNVYKVNGFFWTIKFKSTIGNIVALGLQRSALVGSLSIVDDFVPGSSSNSYIIPNLLPGIKYFVRASASTDVGLGPYTSVESIVPSGVASSVQKIAAGYALNVRAVQEIRLAATHITEIQSITTSAAEMAEVQTFQTSAAPDTCFTGNCVLGKFAFRVPTIQTITISALGPITAGSYSINFARYQADAAHPGLFTKVGNVYDTLKIQWNAEASDVLTALLTLSALSLRDVVVTRDGDGSSDYNYGYIYSITFVGNNVAGETSPIIVSDSTGACGTNCDAFVTTGNVAYTISAEIINPETAMGTDTAVQQVIVSASKQLFAGSYKLIFNNLGASISSTCIPFDAPARGNDVRAMETILTAMTNIDKVYVTRILDPVLAPFGYVYRIFFYGNGVYGTVNTLTYTTTGCSAFQTQENNVLTTNGVNGLVTISMVDQGGFSSSNTFVAAASATAAQLEQDLNQLPIFADVSASRSLVDTEGGYIWTVAFSDSDGNVPQFVCAVDTIFANTVGSACESSTITDGNVLSGSFLVESSDPISFDADAATLKAALEAMSWVGTVQVVRSAATAQFSFTWTITFLTYHGDVPPLMVTSLLVGTGSDIEVTEIRKGNGIDGTFTLSYAGSMTSTITWNATATVKDSNSDGTSVQEKLQALDTVGAVAVTRSTMDEEGGYTWRVTFLDNVLNPGDLPLLQGNSSGLKGVGVVLFLREIIKGSNAVGNQLWLSFDPPVTDNGSPIMKYLVRWDTSAAFDASPAEFAITEPEKLYQTQHIISSAPSFAWSNHMTAYVPEIQSIIILNTAITGNTFRLTFRGASSAILTVGISTSTDLLNALSALSTIGSVAMTPAAGVTLLQPAAVYRITFTSMQGDLPQLISSAITVATTAEIQKGATSFRKEIVVFSCAAAAGTVNFKDLASGLSTDIAFGSTVAALETALIALYSAESDSISVTSSQTLMCATTTPSDVTIVFDRMYGNLNLQITSTVATITMNTAASIDGIYAEAPETSMSGTFQIGYRGEYTRSLNAESSHDDVRYALEDLSTIQTVGVSRNQSYQPITSQGTVDVTNGEIFVTCSAGQVCDFAHAGYGLPGTQIRIGGTWYTIRTDSSSAVLPSSKLYLGDVNGREIGYLGDSATGVTVYEWAKGYVWTVTMMNVDLPLGYLQAKIPRLYPSDSSVKVIGSSCYKCYYIPTQTTKSLIMGQLYYIAVYAYNINGQGLAPAAPASATPSQVPNAPSNVDLVIVSGQQLEVFFSPPALASTNVNPNFNNDISSYIVQWDVNTKFLHGIAICATCCVSLRGTTLTVSSSLATLIQGGTWLTIADQNCALQVTSIVGTTITVATNTCNNFNGRAYPMYYYTYPPAILSGLLTQGSPPYRYLISGLVIATKYFVRVAAVNSVPIQQIALDGNPPNNRKWSYPLSATTKDTVPDPPVSVYLYSFSGTTLEVQFQPPTRDGKGLGGAGITFYWIDVDTVSTFDSPSKASPVEVDVNSGNLPALYAGGPLVYYLKNLQTGVRYFVQVKAKNSVGYSRATIAPNPLAPTRNPDGPVNVKVSTVTSSSTPIDSATVTWQKPVLNGGLEIASYKIEWWGANAIPEVQVIELKWTTAPSSATFTLAFGGGLSGNLPMDVAPENLRSALMNIFVGGVQVVGHVAVSRTTVNVVRGYQWQVTFLSAVNTGDQPMIQLDVNYAGGTGVSWRVFEATTGAAVPQLNFPGKREVQVLLTSHPTATVGGYFRLSYKGSAWSNYLPAAITAGDLQLALEALPTIGQVIVNSGGASLNGFIWTITFDSNVGNVPAIAVDATKITPATAFVGIKDGDNAVRANGILCVPSEDICPGTWSTFTTGIAAMASPGEIADSYQFYETIDASALTYKITGLTTGKMYYVAVTAKNALGLGMRMKSAPVSIIPPIQVPNPPMNVAVNVNPGIATQLSVSWNAPTSTGGADVRMYRIEYDSSPLFTSRGGQQVWCPTAPTYAVWKVKTTRATGNTGDAIGSGYFSLLLQRNNNVQTSEPIPWNAVAMASGEVGGSTVTSNVFCTACAGCADQCSLPHRQVSGSLESKLEYVSSISSVNIQRSAMATDGGYTWTITFMDQGDDFVLSTPSTNRLSCADPTTCNVGVYQVVTTKVTPGVSNSACTGVSVTVPSIGALNKGQLYYMRVFAFNTVGFSLPSNAANPQKPMVVPGPPTGVTLQVLSSTELQILFSPPDDDGGDTITSYQIDWATDNTFATPFTGVMVSLSAGAPYYFVASSLVEGVYYFVRVKAGNSQGYGQYQISSPASLNPYTTPSAPTQVVLGITSDTMLTLQWDAPSDNGGDAVNGYVVQWDISSSFDSLGIDATTVTISDTTQRSYTITTLTTGTVYYVRVAAKNSGGIGAWQASTPVSQAPANQRPGKPNTLTAAVAAAGTLQLYWQVPRIPAHGIPCSGTLLVPQACPTYSDVDTVYGGSAFEGYLIQYSTSSDFSGYLETTSATTSVLLTALNSGVPYFVRVLTVNSEGLKSDFCARSNSGGYLCPDQLVLLDGSVVMGAYVTATPV